MNSEKHPIYSAPPYLQAVVNVNRVIIGLCDIRPVCFRIVLGNAYGCANLEAAFQSFLGGYGFS